MIQTSPITPRKRGPKTDPFSKRDQARITQALSNQMHWNGSWEGTRRGIRFRFLIANTLFGKQIQYEYRPIPRAKLLIERADTVAHAIEFLNRTLKHGTVVKDKLP